MKPLYLEMKGFGPYLQKTSIDFTKLPNHLTLISGNTGAGKTTIFDAICCALFGETSGNNRSFKQMRSKFCQDTDPTEVRFKFELKGKVYEVARSPAFERKKKNSEELTTVAPKAELILPDKTVISKMSNVTEKIKEILGIQKDEFKQIVMIAQNDFMAMIKGTGRTQEEVFNRIFNANLFEDFSRRLLQKKNEAQDKYQNYAQTIISSLDNSGLKYDPDEINSDYINSKKLTEYIDSEEKKISQEVKRTRKVLNQKREILNRANLSKKDALTILDDMNHRDEVKGNLKYLKSQAEEISELEKQRDRANEARDKVLAPFNKVQATRNRINQDYIRLEQAQTEKEDLEKEQERTKQALEKFSDEKLNKLYIEVNNLKEVIPDYKSLSQLSEKLDLQKIELSKLEQNIQSKRIHQEELVKEDEAIKIISREEFKIKTDLLDSQVLKQGDFKRDVEELANSFSKISETIGQLKKRGSGLKELKLQYFKIKTEYDQAFENYIKSQAAFLAQDLKENEPCPVCGSLEHPKPAQFTGQEVSEEYLDELKPNLDNTERVFRDYTENYNQLKQQLDFSIETFTHSSERLKNNLDSYTNTLIQKYLKRLKTYKAQLSEGPDPDLVNLREISNKLSENLKKLVFTTESKILKLQKEIEANNKERLQNFENEKLKEKLAQNIEDLSNEIDQDQENINQLKNKVIEISAQIETKKEKLVYPSYNKASLELSEREQKYINYKSDFETVKNKFEKQRKELDLVKGQIRSMNESISRENISYEKEKEILNQSLKEAGFKSLEEFKENNLSPDKINQLTSKINGYHNQLIQVKEQLKELDKRLENSATRF